MNLNEVDGRCFLMFWGLESHLGTASCLACGPAHLLEAAALACKGARTPEVFVEYFCSILWVVEIVIKHVSF